jgi:hypothetical protein
MRQGRTPLTMRITDEGKRLLELMSERRGVSQTAVVEQLIRDEAERKGLRSISSPADAEKEPVTA